VIHIKSIEEIMIEEQEEVVEMIGKNIQEEEVMIKKEIQEEIEGDRKVRVIKTVNHHLKVQAQIQVDLDQVLLTLKALKDLKNEEMKVMVVI
jgi:hypothetical protein